MRKNELTGWKVLKQLFNVLNYWVCVSFPYIKNLKWLQWINLEKFDFNVHVSLVSCPVKMSLHVFF